VPSIGRGQSLQPLPLYEVVSPTDHGVRSRAIEIPPRLSSLPSTSIRIQLRPATQLHVTAAELIDATHEGWRLWLYAPEATALYPGGIGTHQYVAVFNGVAYRAIPIQGDSNGLNVSVVLEDATESLAASMGSALTSDVKILNASSS
jgi:hypothetical protein